MQPLESFTAIGNVLGRNRRITFNELDGLTFANLSGREATAICGAIEKLDGQLLAHLLAGHALIVDPADTEPEPTQPGAQWGPATPRPAPPSASTEAQTPPEAAAQPQKRPDKPRARPPAPADARASETGAAQEAAHETETGHANSQHAQTEETEEPEPRPKPTLPVDKPPAVVLVAEPETTPKPKPTPPRPTLTAEEVLGKAPKPTPKPKAKRTRGANSAPLKAPPRVKDLPPSKPLPTTGDDYEGQKVAKAVEHSDGGRLLVLTDGVRVKLNGRGKEVARTAAPPSDIDLSADLTPADEIVLKPKKEKGAHPQAIMDTRIVREVITHLLETGVEGIEPLTEACLELRAAGAKSFTSLDDDAVRRRVRSSLTIMDRA